MRTDRILDQSLLSTFLSSDSLSRDGNDMINLSIQQFCSIFGRQTPPKRLMHHWLVVCIGIWALLAAGCGGDSASSSSSTSNNPVPSIDSISPTSAPAGSRALSLTVAGSNFISGSEVRWNGSSRTTTFVSSRQLIAQITPADLASAGNALITVFSPTPGGGTSSSLGFTITSVSALSLLTARLPDAARNKDYAYTLQAEGGITPYTWTVAAGSLPAGLALSSNGVISGTPEAVSQDTSYNVTVQITDFASQASTLTKSFGIRSRSAELGRNDQCTNATTASNGVIRASISPFGDVDVFSFHGASGDRISVETYAQRLALYGDSGSTDVFLDSFLEILDSDCSTLFYSDDIISGMSTDSKISNFTLPGTGTYYIRVSDLRGDGRPDFIYELHLSGAE
jgi:hypothetical protein